MSEEIKILTVKEAAKLLKVSLRTLMRWCENGEFPAFQLGVQWRVNEDDLRSYIDRQKRKAQGRSNESAQPRRFPSS